MIAFLKVNFRWIAGGFLLTYFSSFGQTFFVSASIAEWQAAFGLSFILITGTEPIGLIRDLTMIGAWVFNLILAEALILRQTPARHALA